jgi:Zn-dependent M28 family amino/carboxypeptidase
MTDGSEGLVGESASNLIQQVDRHALARHLAAMPGPRYRSTDAPGIEETLAYLRAQFTEYGWQVRDQPCTDEELGDGLNVVATLPGVRTTNAVVVVGAHHDTVPLTPGADDNGSGLAGVLELARLLGSRRWVASIDLVAFDFEEVGAGPTHRGRFSGSRRYVHELRESGRDCRGAFVFEMIGYRNLSPHSQSVPEGFAALFPSLADGLAARQGRADFIAVLGDATSPLLDHLEQSVEAAVPSLPVLPVRVPSGMTLRDLFRSDHVPFWEAGLPAVMLTDTANYRNPHYHKPSDRPETLSPGFWRDVVAATLGAVAAVAGPA